MAEVRSLTARIESGERATFQKDDVPIAFFKHKGTYYLQSRELQPVACRSFAEAALALLEVLAEWEEVPDATH